MTGLLVSVRDLAEARLALSAGVDLLDVKEPRAGSLGAASCEVIHDVVRLVNGRVPTSAALGELADFDPELARCLPDDLTYAKLGLSRCRDCADWKVRWEGAIAQLPAKIRPVAVCYADHDTAASPAAEEIIDVAQRLGCGAVLVDTFSKQSGGLLDRWPLEQLAEFVCTVKNRGMMAVVAGSLSCESIARVLRLGPDYVAVRGAVCAGGREGAIDGQRLRELVDLIRRRQRNTTTPKALNMSAQANGLG